MMVTAGYPAEAKGTRDFVSKLGGSEKRAQTKGLFLGAKFRASKHVVQYQDTEWEKLMAYCRHVILIHTSNSNSEGGIIIRDGSTGRCKLKIVTLNPILERINP